MVQDYEDASAVTQEAFLAAWQGLPAFRSEARFATWLYCITYHCCLRQLERCKRGRELQAVIKAEQTREGMHREQRAEDILEQRDRRAMVREQREQLPAKYRSVDLAPPAGDDV